MPWKIEKREDKFCVIKESDGSTVHCFPTEEEAKDQLKALYASENKEVEITGVRSFAEFVVKELKSFVKDILTIKDERAAGPITFTKSKDGRMRWDADFSNNFRDNDRPTEILSAEAHERFVKEVDEGVWPMPVLEIWHVDGTDLGMADWLAYDKETGFIMASGYVYPEKEHIAKAIQDYPEQLGVSHGMPKILIERSKNDPSVITHYVSTEISVLPAWAAANPLAEISIGKEINMTIPEAKKSFLKAVGYTDEQLAEREQRNAQKALVAQQAGVQQKEVAPPQETPPEPKPEEVKPVDVPEPEKKPEEKPEDEKSKPITREEVAEAIAATVSPLLKEIANLTAQLAAQEQKAKDIVQQTLADTPAASIGAMVAQMVRATGSKEASIDGRSDLAKARPALPPDSKQPTVVPFLNDLLSGRSAD